MRYAECIIQNAENREQRTENREQRIEDRKDEPNTRDTARIK